VLAPLLVVSVVSFVFIRSKAGEGSTVVVRQQHSQRLTAAAVDRVVRAAPDPVAEPAHARGIGADCAPLGIGGLLNPWRCSILYPSGRQVGYLVTIHADGSYTGDHEFVRYRGRSYPDTGTITGCCVSVP
jgi:hypothetical protein